ncbi:DMT family transporter [Leptolyngbya sp. CCNP1308]|uniref:DMT family transporter n=1 Tax=Leptolyngbya sp. CCNP1308 TaxID=3110255 RepID=UPI002B20B659|nr:DMT family transporter [Leptolyngbya sp. CCNP1308]MEA5449385.1 DMT family transporter [Leptolyngbya sp. CCNP1308]
MIIYLKLLVTMVLWGGTFIAGRLVVQDMGAFAAAFCRFAIASLALLTLTYTIEGHLPQPPRKLWLPIALLGLTGIFAYNVFFFSGLQTVEAGRAALIIALNPVAIALGAALFFKDPLSRTKLLGIGLSLLGAAVVISDGDPVRLLRGDVGIGELFMLGCVVSWMGYSLLGKVVMAELSPFVTTTYACLVGALMLLGPALAEGLVGAIREAIRPGIAAAAPTTWGGLLYLGILGSAVGFTWYYDGLKQLGPARAGVFINLVPVFAIALAALFLQETPTSSLVLGGSLVIAGVVITNR